MLLKYDDSYAYHGKNLFLLNKQTFVACTFKHGMIKSLFLKNHVKELRDKQIGGNYQVNNQLYSDG